MGHRGIEQVLERAEYAKANSDFEYFFALLLAGEALFKTVTLAMVASLDDDKDRNRYRLEYTLARADGLGDWGRALEDALSGPASQFLAIEARSDQTELARVVGGDAWQFKAVVLLKSVLDQIGIEGEEVPVKTDLKRWFRLFATLRNKTRAHGATSSSKASLAIADLRGSIDLIAMNLSLLVRPWAEVSRNYSGKYRVQRIAGDAAAFDPLKKEATHALRNGVYVYIGGFRRVPLVVAGPEVRDLFFANGGMGAKSFEMISYYTDDKLAGDAADYSVPPGSLPSSETEGHGELLPRGNCFSNAPDSLDDYIPRPTLEKKLTDLLLDSRRPIVTLVGRGGIGKTSLSLAVIERLYEESRFSAIVWMSARDVDLQLSGPKPVKPKVVSPDEMGRLYARLVLTQERLSEKGFNARVFFERQLEANDIGPCLYVFDNFETTQNPIEVFNWIDTFIRLPNKVLITTRLRDFKGDYPVDVGGMENVESRELIRRTAGALGIQSSVDADYVDELIKVSDGHPYVIKILLGNVAITGKQLNIDKLIAGNDELLTALFERTYAALTPCAQRALLTLAAWNSSVPRVALEAVLMRSTAERQEVERGVESLIQYSMAELHTAPIDQQPFVRLPLVASSFGKKKLGVSPLKASVLSDVETLQMFGPSRSDDLRLGLRQKMERLISGIARRVEDGGSFEDYSDIVEMICRAYPPGWLVLAKWHVESGDDSSLQRAKSELTRFLEEGPSDADAAEAWRLMGAVCFRTNDRLGEVHAFIERAQIDSVPFFDVSGTANRLNSLLRENALSVDKDERRILAERLLGVLEARRSEADADDFSRMAWLALNIGQKARAKQFVELGLAGDSMNQHCLSLQERLQR
jgi:hypothetical protein